MCERLFRLSFGDFRELDLCKKIKSQTERKTNINIKNDNREI